MASRVRAVSRRGLRTCLWQYRRSTPVDRRSYPRHPPRCGHPHLVLKETNMTFITRKLIVTSFIVVIAVLAALAGFVWSGVYNIGADEPHSGPLYAVLETLRERSIAVRADRKSVE